MKLKFKNIMTPKKLLVISLSLLIVSGVLFNLLINSHQELFYEKYTRVATSKDPTYAMELLAKDIKKWPELVNVCHAIAHEIGHVSYKKYGFQNSLTKFEDDICGSGFMHGVTEEYIANSKSPLKDMLSVCPEGYGACFHGIGHGLLLYYENDLPEAIAGCNLFKNSTEIVQCSEGVFMQNFNTDTISHKNNFINPKNTLYPCSTQELIHKSACYFYSPRYFVKLHPKKYLEALENCQNAETQFIGQCIKGVGSVTMKENIDEPSVSEAVCKKAPEDYRNQCYSGMTSYYIIHIGSLEKARILCTSIDADFKNTCLETVANSANFFVD